ncbi:hypothetical protein EVAR_36265_1 [Eumeta japonica]|uniref:Uncharacterized protein n=1 Tax=Eumeta variegata TaxID=151549 RepID=A0A4C1WXZ5_EUMVA|nr:hypothetical protein EVAR_36265_1 [Eumeta japonica]
MSYGDEGSVPMHIAVRVMLEIDKRVTYQLIVTNLGISEVRERTYATEEPASIEIGIAMKSLPSEVGPNFKCLKSTSWDVMIGCCAAPPRPLPARTCRRRLLGFSASDTPPIFWIPGVTKIFAPESHV